MTSVELDDARLRDTLQRLADGGVREAMVLELAATAQDLEAELTSQIVQKLTKRPRGGLARSWRTTFELEGDELRAVVASSMPYARIQDLGGTIRPVRAKALAIPVEGAGGPRPGQGPRDFPGLEWRPTRNGAGRLVEVTGRGRRRREVTRYILARSVTLPGVRYVDAAVAAVDPTGKLAERVTRNVRAAWEG
jgi:hypothetical protein